MIYAPLLAHSSPARPSNHVNVYVCVCVCSRELRPGGLVVGNRALESREYAPSIINDRSIVWPRSPANRTNRTRISGRFVCADRTRPIGLGRARAPKLMTVDRGDRTMCATLALRFPRWRTREIYDRKITGSYRFPINYDVRGRFCEVRPG